MILLSMSPTILTELAQMANVPRVSWAFIVKEILTVYPTFAMQKPAEASSTENVMKMITVNHCKRISINST